MTEAELIQCEILVLRFQRQDHSAAEELVCLFEKPLLYFLRRMVQSEDDAWELLQETWISAFRSLSKLRDTRTFPAYIYRIARNHALTRLQREKADVNVDSAADLPEPTSDVEPAFTDEEVAEVHAALDELSITHREVLTLFFLEDLNTPEIAAVLEIPPGTVKSRIHHAKKNLKAILTKGDHRAD